MSIPFSSAVWSDAPYKGGTLLVLLALADYADSNGLCWPSVRAIAQKARLGARQVYNVLHRLRRDGIVSVEVPSGGRGVTTRTG